MIGRYPADFAWTMSEAEFKEFKPRLKYGWFHLKLYSIVIDLSRRSIKNRFLADISRGSNSLNLDNDCVNRRYLKLWNTLDLWFTPSECKDIGIRNFT